MGKNVWSRRSQITKGVPEKKVLEEPRGEEAQKKSR